MVRLRTRTHDGRIYYYLEHSIRVAGAVQKKEKYIGKQPPGNVEKAKDEFLHEIYSERWYPKFDEIRVGYIDEYEKVPASAREKEVESFMVKFTYNTQKIEGSTLSLRETAILLEKEYTPGNRPLSDVKETEAHKNVFNEMLSFEKELSFQTILYWHRELFNATKPDIAGRVRNHQVAISGSEYLPPMPVELNAELRDLFRWYNRNKSKLHPVELAALFHYRLVTIHPFGDGNGRTARLVMNFILNKHDYPMLDIPYRSRNSYYNALEKAQKKGDENIFVQWIFRNYIKNYQKYL
jgi:Fic family protein